MAYQICGIAVTLFLLCLPGTLGAVELAPVTARCYLVADIETGEILAAKHAKEKRQPASTTKLMTAILVYEHGGLDETVAVSRRAAHVSPVCIGLQEGEHYTVRDLLKAALIRSANDACVALAEHVAGDEGQFVGLMNDRVQEFGAMDTRFSNAHGLPGPGQYTTAYDLLLIAYAFSQYDDLVDLMVVKETSIQSSEGKTLSVVSRNRILNEEHFGFFVAKTGYTRAAGYCIAGLAGGRQPRVAFAVLGSRRQSFWTEIRALLYKSLAQHAMGLKDG